jgi:autotransporter-associated beta strand protein
MIRTIRPGKSAARLVLGIAAALIFAADSRAQTSFTWTAFASGTWSTGGNWSPGVPSSVNTTDVIFPGILDTAYTATQDIDTPFILHSMRFDNAGGLPATGLQISGNQIQLAGAGPNINMVGPGLVTVSAPLSLPGVVSIMGSNFSGRLNLSGQIEGSGSLLINRPTTNFGGATVLSSTALNLFNGGITLQSGILAVNSVPAANGVANVGSGAITITSTGVGFNATGELRTTATTPATFNVPVNISNGATLATKIQNVNGAAGGAFVFGQSVNGAGGGISVGTIASSGGTYTFEQASNYSGRTDVFQGTLALRGTGGALTGATQLEFYRGSSLTLDSNAATTGTGNVAGNETSQNRIRDDAVISFHQSNFNFTANASATTTETLGTLNGDGGNTMFMTPQTATGAALTINNLNRMNRGVFEWRAANLGASLAGTANTATVVLGLLNGAPPANSLVGGGGADGTTNISIIPFMTASASATAGAGTSLVTYGANGLRSLNTGTEFAPTLQVVPYGPGATNNVLAGVVPLVVGSSPATANSLTLATIADGSNGVYGIGLSGRLNLTSGVAHITASGSNSTFLGVGELNFGGAEAIIAANGQTIINSAITNNSGLTFARTSRSSLLSPNNVISGPITLNQGAVGINDQSQLGGATRIEFHGGILELTNLATGASDILSTPLNVGQGGGSIRVRPVGGASVVGTSQVSTLTGPLTGTGPFQVNGLGTGAPSSVGTLIMAGDASGYSGTVVISGGVLQFDADARLGTGTVVIVGSPNNNPATLHATATTATNRNIYLAALGFIRTDSGVTYTVNGFITGGAGNVTLSELRKVGAGSLDLTREATHNGATVLGNGLAAAASPAALLNVGGTFTLRDQGAILNTSAFTVNAGSTLVADNTGSANINMSGTTRLAPPAADAPARAALCEAENTERVARLARLARVVVPGSRIAQVFCLRGTATTLPGRRVYSQYRGYGCTHADR